MKKGDKIRLRPDGKIYTVYTSNEAYTLFSEDGGPTWVVPTEEVLLEKKPIKVGDLVRIPANRAPSIFTYKVLEESPNSRNVWIARYPFISYGVTLIYPKDNLELVESA
jgi:hypothetical protein